MFKIGGNTWKDEGRSDAAAPVRLDIVPKYWNARKR
jgi:hypothetical protein